MAHPGWITNKLVFLDLPGRGRLQSRVLGVSGHTLVLLAPADKKSTVWPNIDSPASLTVTSSGQEYTVTGRIAERRLKPLPLIFLELEQDIPFALAAASRAEKLIAIASGKGGTGKTFCAINIAWELALRGHKVLLADLDLGTANIATALGIAPQSDLSRVVDGQKELRDVIYDLSPSLGILPGVAKNKDYAALSPWQFNRILTGLGSLEEEWDYIILDTGAGLSPSTTTFLHCADYVVMVINDIPTAIIDGYGLLKAVSSQLWTPRIGLVVNRVQEEYEAIGCANRFAGAAREFLTLPVDNLGGIREDCSVLSSYKNCRPVLASFPSSIASVDLQRVTAALLNQLQTDQARYRRIL